MRELVVEELSCVSGAGEYCEPEGGIVSKLIPDLIFGKDCQDHDQDYRDRIGKNEADSNFLQNMFHSVAESGNPLYYPAAIVYYVAVVIFGGAQYISESCDDSDPAFANVG